MFGFLICYRFEIDLMFCKVAVNEGCSALGFKSTVILCLFNNNWGIYLLENLQVHLKTQKKKNVYYHKQIVKYKYE